MEDQFENAEFSAIIQDHFVPFRFVAGERRAKAFIDSYDIEHIPTMLLVRPDGSEIDRIINVPGDRAQFSYFLRNTIDGTGSFQALLEIYERDPDDIEYAYALLKRYIQRGDLDQTATLARKILDSGEFAKNLMVDAPASAGRKSIYDDTRYLIRTNLNRAGQSYLFRYVNEFPEIRFSESVYMLIARNYAVGIASGETDDFFKRAFRDYPDSIPLKKIFTDYCLHTNKHQAQALKLALELSGTIVTGPESVRISAAVHMLKGEHGEALALYGPQFIEDFANDAAILNEYAAFWASQNVNLPDALDAAQKSVMLIKRHEYWDTLARLYWKLDYSREAVDAQQQAVTLSDGLVPAYAVRLDSMKKELAKRR
ncbi:hypothetical protein ACFL6I_27760 [candidate division KSB1 bacterium]